MQALNEQEKETNRKWSKHTLSPFVSIPVRPARPAICRYLVPSIKSRPIRGCRKITLRAGRLTPAAKVDVAVKTRTSPLR